MSINPRHLIFATAALALAAVQSPAIADSADPTIDFGSLKAEFAAEDAGATYGDKRRAVRASTVTDSRGISAAVETGRRPYRSANKTRADFNTPRDWR